MIKWATYSQYGLSSQSYLSYETDDFVHTLINIWSKLNTSISTVWVSNVAGPKKAELLVHCVKSCWDLKPIFLQTKAYQSGVKNGYINTAQLGIDRWLTLIAAYQLKKGTLCIVDCGTATTVDILLANGHHQGGLIIPGLATMQATLSQNAHGLADFKTTVIKENKIDLLARDTQTGITLGILYTTVGLLEYTISRLEKQVNQKIKFILTGGASASLINYLPRPYYLIPDLVLRGIQTIVVNE